MAETAYIVLRRFSGPTSDESWIEVLDGAIQATSATDAVRRAAASKSPADGTYVAVPARSWKPVTVQAVQITTIKLGEAT